jgi:hypothetical protein
MPHKQKYICFVLCVLGTVLAAVMFWWLKPVTERASSTEERFFWAMVFMPFLVLSGTGITLYWMSDKERN